MEGVKAAEEKELTKSVELLSASIEIAPERASGYNNRAQALRLTNDVEGRGHLVYQCKKLKEFFV